MKVLIKEGTNFFGGIEKWQKQRVNWETIVKEKLKFNLFQCKQCGKISLEIVQSINSGRAPPNDVMK